MSNTSLTVKERGVSPVSLTEAKLNLRVDHDEEDALIKRCVNAACDYIEQITSRSIMGTTWVAGYDGFPSGIIELPMSPVAKVESIKYVDSNNSEQTVSASDYYVDLASEPARIMPVNGWPVPGSFPGSVRIEFVGDNEASPRLEQAVHLLAAHWYENREQVIVGTISSEIQMAVRALLWSDRLPRL